MNVHNPIVDTSVPPSMVLTFKLQGETFAVEVDQVQEIIDPLPMTRVPNAQPFCPGLINVRGAVVPIVDLQYRLGMPPRAASPDTRIVVLETRIDDDPIKVALIADSVSEVIEVDLSTIEPVPELGTRWPVQYLSGVAKMGERLVILLNAETVFRPSGSAARIE